MKHTFIRDLEDRKRQVRHYLISVINVERQTLSGAHSRAEEGRLLTLRAGTFLILYNLMEATTRGAIEAIHDNVIAKNVAFDSLCLPLRKEVIGRFKKGADPAINHTMNDFPSEFVTIALSIDDGIKIAGSVDARSIRELGSRYGFSCIVEKEVRGGVDLLSVKTIRNDLAHGHKTFEEVGRNYTVHELILLSRRTMKYMTCILTNIATYIDNQEYLDEARSTCDFIAPPIALPSAGGTALPISRPISLKLKRLFGALNWKFKGND